MGFTVRVLLLVCALLGAAQAQSQVGPAAERATVLRRGVNITNWFRYPPHADPAALHAYLSDAALRRIRAAGFTFLRIPVQPELIAASPALPRVLANELRRVERFGLAVVVALHPATWRLETSTADRAALLAAWRVLAPALRGLPPELTFPELLNEPVFADSPAAWERLQEQLRLQLRAALPRATLILTGADWGSIRGLLALRPAADPNVIYSVHFYDPAELTSLAAWRADLDRRALARLPFPITDAGACARAVLPTDAETVGVARFYCTQGWSGTVVAARIAAAGAWGRTHGAPVLMGEFGASATLNRTARLAWLAAVRRACEASGLGWALWGYDDVMGFDLPRPPGGETPEPDVLAALGLH